MQAKDTSFRYFERRLLDAAVDDLSEPWSAFPCLLWERATGTFGHGLMDHAGKRLSASREAYVRFKGPIPTKSQIRHYCGIAGCFRPAHLFVPNDATSLEYLHAELANIHDDPDRPWSDYPCLLWKAGTINGYGSLRIDGETVRAPRAAYSIAHSATLGKNDFICHKCDVQWKDEYTGKYPTYRLCFRPSHLFVGAAADNSRDMAEKGRSAWGERSALGKLTEDQVHEIRALSARGIEASRLGRKFSVSKTAIRYILIGRNWAHLPNRQNHTVLA